MCGLAGWNVSPKYAQDNLTEEVTTNLIKIGYLKNLHRGEDAAGWMAYNPKEEMKLEYWKEPGSARDTILDDKVIWPHPEAHSPAVSLHTRAKTSATAKDNDNNHPVIAGSVCVTHNGNIRNHYQIRNKLKLSQVISVDSWVIPATLDKIYDDPSDKDLSPVVDFAEFCEGPVVYAAMWNKKKPYTMLVVGKGREVWIARYKDAIFYASEPEALTAMVACLPDSNKFKFGALRPGQINMLLNGHVSHSEPFEVETTAKQIMTRIRVDDKVDYIMDGNDTRFHWTNEDGPLSIYDSWPVLDDQMSKIEDYKLEDPGKDVPPSMPVGLLAADAIFNWCPEGKDRKHIDARWYFLIGDVELVASGGGMIKDVYNWEDIPIEDRESRHFWNDYIDMDAEDRPARAKLNMQQKYDYKAVHALVAERVKKRQEKERERKEKEDKQRRLPIGAGFKEPGYVRLPRFSADTITTVNVKNDIPQVRVGNKIPLYDKDNFWFVYTMNKMCSQHQKMMIGHTRPQECDTCILNAMETMMTTTSLDDFFTLYGEEAVKVTGSTKMINHEHNWLVTHWRRYDMVNFNLATKDRCKICGMTRALDFTVAEEPFKTLQEIGA